ncbi:hypothetical protein [Pseudomonas reinekei]|jgi:hypothetical protein|uniref:Uncharacterized protein n=1 Tax=Pseudomonas reinekei TaxID=395598 RepID=A0A1Q9X4R7_PSERE|nr:hypothetical protein [Pseudomonas reinekei]KAB0488556.1 hypothetical protein F7R15_01445 [Pseudomonas reinekei]OLU06049.1 hypothetical protein BVK86_01440 [Pseudomonas reinekei]
MAEVRVKAMVLRDVGNRSAVLGTILHDQGLEGFVIGTALWLYGKNRFKGYKWCPLQIRWTPFVAFGFGVRKVSWPDGYF